MHLPREFVPLRLASIAMLVVTLLAGLSTPVQGNPLTAEELVLIVNRREPASRELAEYYMQARGVPEGRICEIDVTTRERMSRADYQRLVVPQVRAFLEEHGLTRQVRCLVTFHGVPLIVGPRELSEDEEEERQRIRAELDRAAAAVVPALERMERLVSQLGTLPAGDATPLSARVGRLQVGVAQAQQHRPQQFSLIAEELHEARARLAQPLAPDEAEGDPDPQVARALMFQLDDPHVRRQMRQLMRTRAGALEYVLHLEYQLRLFETDQSDACLDSELALLWQPTYPAAGWMPNPLQGNPDASRGQDRPVMMTARLDGPDVQTVRDMIAASVLTEREGLSGRIVIDARGLSPTDRQGRPDAFGIFDQQLRDLARFLEANAELPVVLEDTDKVFGEEGGPASVGDVAVYVGWYRLRQYTPGLELNRGAVGYHIASLEMRSLRSPQERGWVRGLLGDGMAATMGPVSEPYLHAFPPPGQFIPLLLTGERTLAEVYWATVPMTSWKLGLVGDPLYRPFAAKPALRRSERAAPTAPDGGE